MGKMCKRFKETEELHINVFAYQLILKVQCVLNLIPRSSYTDALGFPVCHVWIGVLP